jgi:CO dehydrogenase/acetyl-CoA synthase gamma subunit (corrinoid Fe-S protein)
MPIKQQTRATNKDIEEKAKHSKRTVPRKAVILNGEIEELSGLEVVVARRLFWNSMFTAGTTGIV